MKIQVTKRRLLPVLILAGLLAAVIWFVWGRTETTAPVTPAPNGREAADHTESSPANIRLVASGDMLPHETVAVRAKTAGSYDFQQFFTEVEPIFKGADIRYCNQEALSAGEQFGLSYYPTFNAPTKFAEDLSAVGCNLVSLANNHINDKGQAAINMTLDVWDGLKPLAHSGANRSAVEQAADVQYFEVKGVKFAFAAYAEFSNNRNVTAYGLNLLNENLVHTHLTEARQKADIVLVSVHWGAEYSAKINAYQDRWATIFAGLGADVVIGSGPHVLEPVKRLPKAGGGETLVWYSLGNMLSSQLQTESLVGGFAIMDFDPDSKQLTRARFLPTYMHYEWTAQDKARDNLLARENLKIYPLDKAADPLARSLHNTTVAEQTARINTLLNTYTEIPVITSSEY